MKRFAKAALLLALALAVPAWAYNVWELPEDEAPIYEQLSAKGQYAYDQLTTRENLAKVRSGEPVTVVFTGESTAATIKAEERACVEALNTAYGALVQNHPEIFWLAGSNVSWISPTSIGGRYELELTLTYVFQDQWASGGRSVYQDEATVRSAVEEIAAEACVQGGPYDQLLYAHDWLTHHNVYNDEAAMSGAGRYYDYLPWTPLSALTDETQPVCEGLSRAFAMICEELGYPCIYVSGWAGGPHAWNMVQVAGKWYAVDVTFDDPSVTGAGVVSGRESHDYFMLGEETLIDGYHVFSDNHFPTGDVTNNVSFTYPALAAEALDPSFSWGADWPGWDEPEPEPEPDFPGTHVFADVPEGVYYYPAVQWAVAVGVTNGTGTDAAGNALFSPDATVTRGQAVTFLWRAMGEPEPETAENLFQDVAAGSYYEKAVLWAVENGITNGTAWDEAKGVFEFSPDASVTRDQMLTFLWRAMGRPGETEPYEDKAWNADAEAWAAEYGVADGTAQPYSVSAACPRSDVVYYLFHAVLLMAG